jgi:hypothetical protein
VIPSLEAIGLLSFKGTDLQGYFDLNVRRREAARTYLRLFVDNQIDAILMPPAAHTAVPLDTWTTATYTGLWNYLDYPALTIPVDVVTDVDQADNPSNAKNGPDDERVYSLCMCYPVVIFKDFQARPANSCHLSTKRHWARSIQSCSNSHSAGRVSTCR